MEFTKKAQGLKRALSGFRHRLTVHARRLFAILIGASLVLGGLPYAFFQAFAAEGSGDYVYELERTSVCEALDTAVMEGTTLDEELRFLGDHKEEYDELFMADGTLYELKDLEVEKDRDRDKVLDLRVFARIQDDIPLDGYYEISGDESVIFLFINKSKEPVTVTAYIDESEMETIEIIPASEVSGDSESIEEADSGAASADAGGGTGAGTVEDGMALDDESSDEENEDDSEISDDVFTDGYDGGDKMSDDSDEENSASEAGSDDSGTSDEDSEGSSDTADGSSDSGESSGSDSGSGAGSDPGSGSDSASEGGASGNDGSTDHDDSGKVASVSAKSVNRKGTALGLENTIADVPIDVSASEDNAVSDYAPDDDYGFGTAEADINVPASPSDAVRSDEEPDTSGTTALNTIGGDLYEPVRLDAKYSAVAFATTAEELGLASSPVFGEQTVSADIYKDSSYDLISAEDTCITLSGRMPHNAQVKAYPVDVEIEGLNIIAAYDITIFDRYGQEFEPDDEIEVVMDSDRIREALEDGQNLVVYHMKDEYHTPEEVPVISADDGGVSFLADRFSVYLLASGVMPLAEGDTAFAVYSEDDGSLTFYADASVPAVGDIYPESDGKTVTNTYQGFDTDTYNGTSSTSNRPPWYDQRNSITSVTFDKSFKDVQPVAMAYWFYGFTNLTEINAENLNTSAVTTLNRTFYNCYSLTSLDDLANWNTSNVTTLEYTFYNCNGLTNVDILKGWDVSKVETLYGTFDSCSYLTNVDGLADWNTSNVTTLYTTFVNCGNLTNVDGLANWDTSNVTSLYGIFWNCSRLIDIDVSNWVTSNVTIMSYMFSGCTNLKTIYSNDANFVTDNVNYDIYMFEHCASLVGGNGTPYSSNNIGASMAHVDTAANPGYFAAGYGLEIYKYTGDIFYDDVWSGEQNPLAGAEFELRDSTDEDAQTAWFSEESDGSKTVYTFVDWTEPDDGGVYTQTLVSGSDGMIYVEGLETGTYYLYETKAPSGYNLLTEPVEVAVSDSGTTRVNIQNTVRTLLPNTGGPGTLLYEISGLLLMGCAVLMFVLTPRRRRKCNG